MRTKKVLALLAAAFTCLAGAPAITSNAASLTQASSADQVSYGTVTAEDKEMLKGIFDAAYYLEQNPDLAELYGNDIDKLFEHFCTLGIFEGRGANPNFDPAAYASAYKDLKEAFGTDILKYYTHYIKSAASENRTITTLEAAANAGITVVTFTATPVQITPQVYKVAKALGTTNYSTVATAVESAVKAAAEGQTTTISNGDSNVVITPETLYDKSKNLTQIGTIELNKTSNIALGSFVIAIYTDSNNNYGAYDGISNSTDISGATVLASTPSFDASTASKIVDIYIEAHVADPSELASAYTTSEQIADIKGTLPDGGVLVMHELHYPAGSAKAYDIVRNVESTGNTFQLVNSTIEDVIWCNDAEGTEDSTYSVGIDITKNEDGSASLTFGVNNEETEFATYCTLDINESSSSDSTNTDSDNE